MNLTIKQTKAIDYLEDKVTNEIGYGGGAGGGKSLLGCYWQLKTRLKYPETAGLIGRSKLKTLKQTTLVTFFQVAKMQGVLSEFTFNSQSGQINFNNGSVIYLKDLFDYPSDPEFDELGSLEITDASIDESAQVSSKAYSVVQSRIRYNLDRYDLIPKILWTSNPSKNWNYTQFYKPWRVGNLPSNRAFVQSLATDNKHISKHYLDNLDKLPKSSRERLKYGNWEYDDNPDALCEYENITALFDNDHVLLTGEKFLTADIARFGSDKAIILTWDNWNVINSKVFDISSTTDIQNYIINERIKHGIPKHNCVADADGVGGGVVDNTGIDGFVNNAKPTKQPENDLIENYRNLQVQCIYYLVDKINSNQINIIADLSEDYRNEITEEIEYIHADNKDVKKLDIKSKSWVKDQIGRSPDWRDALLMRAWFDVKPKAKETFLF